MLKAMHDGSTKKDELTDAVDYINLVGSAYDVNDDKCNTPDLTPWSIGAYHIFPDDNPLMNAPYDDEETEDTGK
jgi:hypothetical protein